MRIWPSYFICVTIIFMSCQIFGLPLRDSNIKDYLEIYNLFLKFNGNVQFINLVEGKILLKYKTLIKEY